MPQERAGLLFCPLNIHCGTIRTVFVRIVVVLSEVDAQLMEEARVVEEVDRFVVLSIKEDDKHNCVLIGFTNNR